MADRKISDLTALTTPASGDYLPIVDISEASAANKNKRITIEELLRGAPDGTAGAPGIAFESDPNTGIYSPGADAFGVVTAGTERLRITSDGKVGLGSSDPGSLGGILAVQKNQTADTAIVVDNSGTSGASTSSSFIVADGGATRGWFRRYRDGTGNTALGFTDAFLFEGNIGGTKATRMVIDSSGRVGVGTASPSSLLHLADAGDITVGTTTGTKIGTATSQKIGFFDATPVVQPTTGVAEAAFVENSGGTAVNVDSTFGGYTLQQVVQALQNLGILA